MGLYIFMCCVCMSSFVISLTTAQQRETNGTRASTNAMCHLSRRMLPPSVALTPSNATRTRPTSPTCVVVCCCFFFCVNEAPPSTQIYLHLHPTKNQSIPHVNESCQTTKQYNPIIYQKPQKQQDKKRLPAPSSSYHRATPSRRSSLPKGR